MENDYNIPQYLRSEFPGLAINLMGKCDDLTALPDYNIIQYLICVVHSYNYLVM